MRYSNRTYFLSVVFQDYDSAEGEVRKFVCFFLNVHNLRCKGLRFVLITRTFERRQYLGQFSSCLFHFPGENRPSAKNYKVLHVIAKNTQVN